MKDVENVLWNLNVEDLKSHGRKLGIKGIKGNKECIVHTIMDFYNSPTWLEDYFQTLDGFDKEYTYLIVQSNFCPIREEVNELKEKYNIKKDYSYSWDRYKDNLKFSIEGYIPPIFREELLKLVPERKIEFVGLDIDINNLDCNDTIVNDNNPIKKFDDFIKFINTNKIKATEKNNTMTKSGIIKFAKETGINEIIKREDTVLENIRNSQDTVIINSIVKLLLCSKIIKVSDGYFKLGTKYQDYIKLNIVDKCKYLFNNYLNSSYDRINEIEHINNYVYKTQREIFLTNPREEVIKYLKLFPINKWVDTTDLKHTMRIKDRYFLQRYTGEILQRDDYENWYYRSNFEDLEYSFIDCVLMDYLAVLGIIDVIIYDSYNDRGERYFLTVGYNKLTEFGAMVLNLINPDIIKQDISDPITINDNFDIMIKNSARQMEYELYFDRFLKKVEVGDDLVYKLTFEGLAKANDLGIKPDEILEYLKNECSNIPNEVIKHYSKWERSFNKIKIRTVTILEAPTELMDIIKINKKVIDSVDSNKKEHVIIKKSKINDVKKEIEKNNLFCIIED